MMTKYPFDEFLIKGGLEAFTDVIDDVYITFFSFEERSLAPLQYISSNYRCKNVLCIINTELEDDLKYLNQFNKLCEHLQNISENFEIVRSSQFEIKGQIKMISRICEVVSLATNDITYPKIKIDITSFTREQLLSVLFYLRKMKSNLNIDLIYVSPTQYATDYLSKGCCCIRNVLGFPGQMQLSKKCSLISLVGYESHRVLSIIDEYEPVKVFLGIGNPPTDSNFIDKNFEEVRMILSRQEVETFECDVTDLNIAYNSIEKLYLEYSKEYNILISPMNTKISTVAAFLLAEKYRDIQLTYCIPCDYNYENYSTGIKNIYLFKLPQKEIL